MDKNPLVELIDINKSFPGVKALTDVNISFYSGKVHVLLGENGAGKSTIIKVISGVYQATSGQIIVKGEETHFNSIKESSKAGISVIHQELSVIPDLTVAENIFLGREPKNKTGFIDKKKMNHDTAEIFQSMGININPKTLIRKLNNGDKQMVEIARAVSQNSELVIMDEPTSSLSDREVRALFKVVETLKSKNVAIIYISHRLKEITEIGDTVTILRDGNVVATKELSDISEKDMITLMVGREMTQFYYKSENAIQDEIVLDVSKLSKVGAFSNVSFQLKKGEILGVAGLVGAGRTEVMRGIFGADKLDGGDITVFGKKFKPTSVEKAIASGIGLIPEDRRNQALLLDKSVRENTTLASVREHANHGFIDFKWERVVAEEYIEKMRTKTPSDQALIKNLSGGNQQKVVIARWLIEKAKILIMDEPTRGIDVNAKAEIYSLMKEFVEAGGSIIMVSSDLPEVLGVSDRIMVLCEGRVSGFLEADVATEERIMELASVQNIIESYN